MWKINEILEPYAHSHLDKLGTYYKQSHPVEDCYIIENKIFILTHRDEEDSYYAWEIKKRTPLLEKLTKHYLEIQELDNYGHAVAYSAETEKKVPSHYEFPKGTFSIRSVNGKWIHFNYDPKK